MDCVLAARARFLTNGKNADHEFPIAPSPFALNELKNNLQNRASTSLKTHVRNRA